METISAKYASSNNRKEKLELLSIVVSIKGYCHRKVHAQNMTRLNQSNSQISSLLSVTKYQIRTAIDYSKGLFSIEKYKRVRFDRARVSEFVSFLSRFVFFSINNCMLYYFRSSLIASLPYGDCQATLSDGSTMNVASVCRLYSYSRIIREYHSELKVSSVLSESIAHYSETGKVRHSLSRQDKSIFNAEVNREKKE